MNVAAGFAAFENLDRKTGFDLTFWEFQAHRIRHHFLVMRYKIALQMS